MCNEIISYVKRILRGFDLTPEKMGLDTIRNVGPGGNFMAEMHTVKNFRQEQWRVQFMNRDEPDTWEKKGSKTYADRVLHQALTLVETHEPERCRQTYSAR